MTGAPSLTCPECGHTVKCADKLHRRRRRHPRAAMLFVLVVVIVTLMWYASVIRWRVRTLGEPLRLAMTPTTVMLLEAGYGGHDAITGDLHGRLFDGVTGKPIASRPQQWLAAHMLYRRSMKLGTIIYSGYAPKPVQDIGYLLDLAKHNSTAAELWLRMSLEHPDKATRSVAIRIAVAQLKAATFGPEARRQVVAAWRAGRINDWELSEFLLAIPAADRAALTDADALEDAAIAFEEHLHIQHQEVFLADIVRRKVPAADAIIAAAEKDNTYSVDLRILLSMAKAKLHDRPPPCSIELRESYSPQAQFGVVLTMNDELRDAILALRMVHGVAPAAPDYKIQAQIRTSAGPTAQQTPLNVAVVRVPPATQPSAGAVYPKPKSPTHVRVVLSSWASDTIDKIADNRLMPVSNEIIIDPARLPPPGPAELLLQPRANQIIVPGDPRH